MFHERNEPITLLQFQDALSAGFKKHVTKKVIKTCFWKNLEPQLVAQILISTDHGQKIDDTSMINLFRAI